MSPEERRDWLIDATVPLLYQHGRAVTTRLIAEAAGVAEGTIFRVFPSKEDLVDAALTRAMRPGEMARRLDEIATDAPLEERLVRMTAVLQQRFRAVFGLMRAVGMVAPPPHLHDCDDHARAIEDVRRRLVALVESDAERLAVAPDELVHRLRLLTFAGSHPEISDGRLLTPDQIVDTVLHGVLKRED